MQSSKEWHEEKYMASELGRGGMRNWDLDAGKHEG